MEPLDRPEPTERYSTSSHSRITHQLEPLGESISKGITKPGVELQERQTISRRLPDMSGSTSKATVIGNTTTTAGSTSPIKKLVSNVKNAYEVMKAGVGKVTTKVAAKASAGVEKARKVKPRAYPLNYCNFESKKLDDAPFFAMLPDSTSYDQWSQDSINQEFDKILVDTILPSLIEICKTRHVSRDLQDGLLGQLEDEFEETRQIVNNWTLDEVKVVFLSLFHGKVPSKDQVRKLTLVPAVGHASGGYILMASQDSIDGDPITIIQNLIVYIGESTSKGNKKLSGVINRVFSGHWHQPHRLGTSIRFYKDAFNTPFRGAGLEDNKFKRPNHSPPPNASAFFAYIVPRSCILPDAKIELFVSILEMVNIRTALGPSEGGQWKNVCQDIGLEYNPTREFVLSNAVCGGSRKNMSYAEVKKAASSAGGIARQNISRKDNDGLTTIEVWIRDNPEEMKRVHKIQSDQFRATRYMNLLSGKQYRARSLKSVKPVMAIDLGELEFKYSSPAPLPVFKWKKDSAANIFLNLKLLLGDFDDFDLLFTWNDEVGAHSYTVNQDTSVKDGFTKTSLDSLKLMVKSIREWLQYERLMEEVGEVEDESEEEQDGSNSDSEGDE